MEGNSIISRFRISPIANSIPMAYICSAIIKKDGGNWSCDVLATHPPQADKGATSYPRFMPGER